MRIVLSRKGVDSGAGGLPSPILNNELVSLPIPSASQITYDDLSFRGISFGTLVENLSRGRLRRNCQVHLDPDLRPEIYPREEGWRPVFGQGEHRSKSHLQRCGVTVGDLFLFFGWFREAECHEGKYRYKPGAPDVHVIFGWLQVGAVVSCEDSELSDISWARYHPHFRSRDGTAYVSSRSLYLGFGLEGIAGAGYFTRYNDRLRLTAPGSEHRRVWQLPRWFYPRDGCFPLTYHQERTPFSRRGKYTIMRSSARGQEFVLDTREYYEAISWARVLITKSKAA